MKQNTKSPALFGMRNRHAAGYLLRVATLASLVLWLGSATAHAQDFGPVGSGYSSEDFARDPFTAAHNQTIAQNQTAPFKEMARKNQEAGLLRQEGMNLEKKGQWREAVAKYKESLTVQTDHLCDLAFVSIGDVYLRHGYNRVATEWYAKYVYSEPGVVNKSNNVPPVIQYCLLLCNAGRWDEAATVYTAAREILARMRPGYHTELFPVTMHPKEIGAALFSAYCRTILALHENDDKSRYAMLAVAQRLAPGNAVVSYFAAQDGPDRYDVAKTRAAMLRAAASDRDGAVRAAVDVKLAEPR